MQRAWGVSSEVADDGDLNPTRSVAFSSSADV